MKILIVCEHASDVFGGEAMLPLNYFRWLTLRGHECFLVTHERVKSVLDRHEDLPKERIFYIPDTKLHKLLFACSKYFSERINLFTFGFMMHLVTQFYQWKISKQIIREFDIDILHEPSPVSPVQPSAMFGLGIPVIIGPMNGGMDFPKDFQYMKGNAERVLYKVLRFFPSIYNLLIPGKFFANALLVANKRTENALPKVRLGEVIELVENGVFSAKSELKSYELTELTNVLYVGRLIDLKKVEILIKAVHLCQSNVALTIVGDGPMRARLQSINSDSKNSINFVGSVSHSEVNHYYDNADIFVLPSVRECGGAVILEAMSRGVPVIATDWGGPADYLNRETGILIKPDTEASMIKEFSIQIDYLAKNPQVRKKMAEAALLRVKEHFTWERKIETIESVYSKYINKVDVK